MKIEETLDYQTHFFDAFSRAWRQHSDLQLYQQIDNTAASLHLDITEVPGYILAYDQEAQKQLHDYLQKGLIDWLKIYLPFFEIDENGVVMFGDWYHRRRFGVLDTWRRQIIQTSPAEEAVIPELQAFAEDPQTFLDRQLKRLEEKTYAQANQLKRQLNDANATATMNPETAQTTVEATASRTGKRLSSFLANLMDTSEDETTDNTTQQKQPAQNQNRPHVNTNALQLEYAQAQSDADAAFAEQKRPLEVDAAVVNYEYRAIMDEYSSFNQFLNALQQLPQSYSNYLSVDPKIAARNEGEEKHD